MCARSLESMQRVELLIESSEEDEQQPTANEGAKLVRVYRQEKGGKDRGKGWNK